MCKLFCELKVDQEISYNNSRVDISLTGYAPHGTERAAFPHSALYKTNYSTTILRIHSRIFSVLLMDMPLAYH